MAELQIDVSHSVANPRGQMAWYPQLMVKPPPGDISIYTSLPYSSLEMALGELRKLLGYCFKPGDTIKVTPTNTSHTTPEAALADLEEALRPA